MPMCDWSSDVCSRSSRPRRGIASPVASRRGEGAQRKRCRDPRCSPRGQLGKGIGNKAINGPWRGRPKRRRSHKLVPDMSRHCGGVLSQQRIASPFLRGTEKETESGSESRSVIATPWTIQSMEFSRPRCRKGFRKAIFWFIFRQERREDSRGHGVGHSGSWL